MPFIYECKGCNSNMIQLKNLLGDFNREKSKNVRMRFFKKEKVCKQYSQTFFFLLLTFQKNMIITIANANNIT